MSGDQVLLLILQVFLVAHLNLLEDLQVVNDCLMAVAVGPSFYIVAEFHLETQEFGLVMVSCSLLKFQQKVL